MSSTIESPDVQAAFQTALPRQSSLSNPTFKARWIDSIEELENLQSGWERLAASSVWKNLSFEPFFLIPALKHLNDVNARVLVVESIDEGPTGHESQLVGLVPLYERSFHRLPIKCVNIWKHDQCFDGTPLIHQDFACDALQCMTTFLGTHFGLFNLDTVSAEPGILNALQQMIKSRGLKRFVRDSWERAAIIPADDPEAYVTKHVSKSIKKTTRRLSRRLEEQGKVEFEISNETSDHLQLAEQFLDIEASGWKGKNDTALACHKNTKDFYLDMITRSSVADKARFVSLKLDGNPIAIISDLQSNGVISSYKTAYDDNFSEYSPGGQNELENVLLLAQNRDITLADSCTEPDNDRINRMWGQRIRFESFVLALQPGPASWVVKMMPTLKSAAQQMKNLFKSSRTK